MKKITLIVLLFSLFIQKNMAQITITNNDLPDTDTNYIRDNAGNTAIIDLNVTGANQTWDYTQLTATGSNTITYQTVGSTSFGYQFYFNNNFLYPDYYSDLAQPGINFPAIPAVPITITDVINYFKKSPSGYYQTGFGATISGLPASVRYNPRDKVLPIPCTYGITESNNFAWLFNIPTIGNYGQNKTRTNEVDGWGTLKLPFADYNVLRVKSTVVGVDTVYISALNFGIAIPSTQIEYKWYANGEGEPVLTVTAIDVAGNSQITGANYKHTDDPNGINEKSMLHTNLDVFPNPSSNQINVKYYTPITDKVAIEIIDITGKQVKHLTANCVANTNNSYPIDITDITKGFYELVLTQNGSISVAKLIIE
jgi:hypothetical protein